MHHRNVQVFLLLSSSFTALLSGCVNLMAEMPESSMATDPVQYTDQFLAATDKGLINPYNIILPLFNNDNDHYQTYRRFVCAKPDDHQKLREGIELVCRNMNGVFDESNVWCKARHSNQPLFGIKSFQGRKKCGTGTSIEVLMLAPSKKSSASDTAWIEYAKSMGFDEKLGSNSRSEKMVADIHDIINLGDATPPPPPTTPQNFSAQMTPSGPQLWNLVLNKTKLEELPRDCFFHNPLTIPVDEFDYNYSLKGPTLYIFSSGMEGTIDTKSTDQIGKCYAPGIKEVSASFVNNSLRTIHVSADAKLNLKPKILAGLGPLKARPQGENHVVYEGKGFFLRWSRSAPIRTNSRSNSEEDSFYIQSTLPDKSANEFLKKNGYPKHGPFELGHSSKKSLASFMRLNGFSQKKLGKIEQGYLAALEMFPIGRKSQERLTVAYRLGFDERDILYQVQIGFPDALTKSELEKLLGNDFIYIGKTHTGYLLLNPYAERARDYVYWHKDFTPRKTGTYALYSIHAHYGEKTGKIKSITLVTGPHNRRLYK